MARFTVALSLLLLGSNVEAKKDIPASLARAARAGVAHHPELRKQEVVRRNALTKKIAGMSKRRKLQNGYYNYYDNGDNGNYNGYSANDYADIWENEYYWNNEMAEEEFGFQISDYAIKFTQCATVETFSDYLAEDEESDTVLAAQRFAIFRLCPKNECSSYSNKGCGSNYGEYVVAMDQYLAAILDEEEQRVVNYCTYCQTCADLQAYKAMMQEVEYRRQSAVEQAEENFQEWYETYVANEEENGYQNNYQNMYNNYANGQYGNNYQNNGEQNVDSAQRYYQYIRTNSNYANNYYNNNYAQNNNNNNNNNQNGMNYNDYKWTNADFWNMQEHYNNAYQEKQNWQDVGGMTSTRFYGKPVYNGYYDQNGDFVEVYGYFDNDGQYVSLEEEIEWDYSLFGEMPESWGNIDLENTEQCNAQYSSACYNQYDSCMMILQDGDYMAYQQNKRGYGDYDNQEHMNNGDMFTLKDFMDCTEIEMFQEGNDYANQEYYGQQYYNKQQYFEEQYNCYEGDEDCEAKRDYAMAQYEYEMQEYMNRRYFIGPHCSTDGRSISLAVYKDEFCTVMDDETSVEDLIGYDPVQDVDLVPDDCIACGVNEENLENFAWYDEEDQEIFEVEPMCSMLYQLSGKCNEHLEIDPSMYYNQYQQEQNQDWEQVFQSEQQERNEEAVCAFVQSLKSNTYDENGQVMLDGAWKNPNQWSSEFQAESRALSAGKKFFIALLSMAVATMGVWACFLHGTLARKNIPWRPRRKAGEIDNDPTHIARQNSGIVMGRSRSGPGSTPFI